MMLRFFASAPRLFGYNFFYWFRIAYVCASVPQHFQGRAIQAYGSFGIALFLHFKEKLDDFAVQVFQVTRNSGSARSLAERVNLVVIAVQRQHNSVRNRSSC